VRLDQIQILLSSGRYQEAYEELALLSDRERQLPSCLVAKLDALTGLGRWQELADLGGAAIKELQSGSDSAGLGKIHGLLGFAFFRMGDGIRAERHLRAAVHILTWDVGDPISGLRQQRRLALIFLARGLYRQACHEMEQAISAADEYGANSESGILRVNLAVALTKSGELSRIPSLLDDSEAYLRQVDRAKWSLLSHLVRANYFRITGDIKKALQLLEPALQTCREQRYSREEAITLEYIGDCHLAGGDHTRALDLYLEGMKIAETTAPKGDLVPELCHRIAECRARLGDANEAILFCERGLRVARDLGDRYEECATHRVLAISHRAAGNPTKALRIADEGIELGRSYETPYELARMLVWAGETRLTASGLDEQALGRKQLWEARGHFIRMGLAHWVERVDQALGYESVSEQRTAEPDLAPLSELDDLDRGALRFGLVTCSPRVREAVAVVQSIAPSTIPVLICGESGVGKELLARAVHQMSDRRKGPFVAINCGGIASGLLESEMFGHERGAFTGAVSSREGLIASADKGTLFLDEIADLPLPAQASLLRVLESGEIRPLGKDDLRRVDIRIVAATNAPLEELVPRGTFRQDLFFRLNGVRVTLPPLRDREEDIRALFRYFWSQACSAARKTLRVAMDVEPMLAAYEWPGNVRELRHEIARVVALAPDGSIATREQFLPGEKRKNAFALRRGRERREALDVERNEILTALRAHGGNKAEAARSLGGMKRTTLIYRMERLGIRPEEYEIKE
jgi:DNA-binding NtrC family response regulator/tetratricopeptide (TPR) repeat protein